LLTNLECRIQRYEGASTLYGPHTLAAYINVTLSLIPYLSASTTRLPSPGPNPPDNSNRSLNFIPGVLYDRPPLFKKFGEIVTDVEPVVQRGTSVFATFVGANPRNNLRLEKSYAIVEKLIVDETSSPSTYIHSEVDESLMKKRSPIHTSLELAGKWQPVRDDSDWHLVFRWRRTNELLATSEVTTIWEIEEWAEPGTYRLRYYGDAKSLTGSVTEFEGVSGEFKVV
jgi:neutral ceramidase